ncbi:MAG: lytic transglycosylase domain-containing protein, partial [Actinomyces sp.]
MGRAARQDDAVHPRVPLVVGVLVVALFATACGTGPRPRLAGPSGTTGSDTTSSDTGVTGLTDTGAAPADTGAAPSSPPPTTTTLPPAAPNGRRYPVLPADPAALVDELVRVDAALRDPTTPVADLPDLGHTHQMIIRLLARHPEWDVEVFTLVPDALLDDLTDHISARRAFADLSSGVDTPTKIPAWEIVEPAPLDDLRAFYAEAEATTGIGWEYLAAINLVETGMGRIVGLSTAGARGPMQFIPSTWEEVGEGDIDDPHDAIVAAARYLVRRGGPDDMAAALWGYNNHDSYVEGVERYASILRRDPLSLVALYNWEIHFFATAGDLWLPVGTR